MHPADVLAARPLGQFRDQRYLTGAEVRHVTNWWEHPVDLDFVFHDPAYVREAVADAGLTVVEWYLRGPLADAELDNERLCLLAKPHTDASAEAATSSRG